MSRDEDIQAIREGLTSVPRWVDDPKGDKKRGLALSALDRLAEQDGGTQGGDAARAEVAERHYRELLGWLQDGAVGQFVLDDMLEQHASERKALLSRPQEPACIYGDPPKPCPGSSVCEDSTIACLEREQDVAETQIRVNSSPDSAQNVNTKRFETGSSLPTHDDIGHGRGVVQFGAQEPAATDDGLYFYCSAETQLRNLVKPQETAPSTGYWWCPECRIKVDAHDVTFSEAHDRCGCPVEWRTDPAPSVDARELVDQILECAPEKWGRIDPNYPKATNLTAAAMLKVREECAERAASAWQEGETDPLELLNRVIDAINGEKTE
jgi:hypothetical protein